MLIRKKKLKFLKLQVGASNSIPALILWLQNTALLYGIREKSPIYSLNELYLELRFKAWNELTVFRSLKNKSKTIQLLSNGTLFIIWRACKAFQPQKMGKFRWITVFLLVLFLCLGYVLDILDVFVILKHFLGNLKSL